MRGYVQFNKHTHTHADGVARGAVKDNERCNDRVEEVDEIEVDSRKRKRRDNVASL